MFLNYVYCFSVNCNNIYLVLTINQHKQKLFKPQLPPQQDKLLGLGFFNYYLDSRNVQKLGNTYTQILFIINSNIKNYKNIIFLLLLATIIHAQFPPSSPRNRVSPVIPQQFNLQPIKKGLTFQATRWPTAETNWAGRFSCNNCNPFQGDQFCNRSLPVVFLTFQKTLVRPFYPIDLDITPFAISDGGFYDGWTGGVLQVTSPVRGYDIPTYQKGDQLCKGYFGPSAKFASFNDGFYMPMMNQRPMKSWCLWDWKQTQRGGWNLWGYFNHHYRGRAWVYSNQPKGNCGEL